MVPQLVPRDHERQLLRGRDLDTNPRDRDGGVGNTGHGYRDGGAGFQVQRSRGRGPEVEMERQGRIQDFGRGGPGNC